jgi:hypothetical protein
MPPQEGRAERRGLGEWAAIILLLFGGFVFVVGWFAGLVLLWSSRAWNTRDKWIGTLVIPGGLATALVVGLIVGGSTTNRYCSGFPGGVQHCTNAGGPSTGASVLGVVVLAICVLAPIATSVYLARRAT